MAFLQEHGVTIIAVLTVVIILIIVAFGFGINLASMTKTTVSKSTTTTTPTTVAHTTTTTTAPTTAAPAKAEYMTPWKAEEMSNMQSAFNMLSSGGENRHAEYLANKSENGYLEDKLYS